MVLLLQVEPISRTRRWWSRRSTRCQDQYTCSPADAGTANTGGGGGGAGNGVCQAAGIGGSGIVILRAPGPVGPTLSVTPEGAKATLPGPAGGCTVVTFTATGTLTIS